MVEKQIAERCKSRKVTITRSYQIIQRRCDVRQIHSQKRIASLNAGCYKPQGFVRVAYKQYLNWPEFGNFNFQFPGEDA